MEKKDDKPRRRTNGTFEKGSTGNKKGRPKTDLRIPAPETIRDMHYDVMEFRVHPQLNGRAIAMNLIQANLLTLGIAGMKGDVRAAEALSIKSTA